MAIPLDIKDSLYEEFKFTKIIEPDSTPVDLKLYLISTLKLRKIIQPRIKMHRYICCQYQNRDQETKDMEYLLDGVPECSNYSIDTMNYNCLYIWCTVFKTHQMINYKCSSYNLQSRSLKEHIETIGLTVDCKIGLSIAQFKLFESLFLNDSSSGTQLLEGSNRLSLEEENHMLRNLLIAEKCESYKLKEKLKETIPIENRCCICFEYTPKKSSCVPCGHTQYCDKCIGVITTCSICRTKIEKVIKIF
jgi:hypothetical protein